ncbi:MAG: hypothetical protein KDA25_03625 [Phycisphaerales bacterium]|nr:hypothetical protein [Phycisphaerales bacterium]
MLITSHRRMLPTAVACAVAAVLSFAAVLLSGCGAVEEPPPVVQKIPYSDLDELVAALNEVTMSGSTIDAMHLLSFYRMETPQQEADFALVQATAWRLTLLETLWTLNDGAADDRPQPLAPNEHPIVVTSRDDRRATGEQIENDDSITRLQFVEIDGRWWVSGYTIEQDPEHQDRIAAMRAEGDDMVRFYTIVMPHVVPRFIAAFQNRTFRDRESIQEFTRSVEQACTDAGITDARRVMRKIGL